MQRGSEFSIMLGQAELMNSRSTGSEKALAALACKRIGPNERPEVLIGGLGMGFTLRAALSELGASARIVVAELVPAVVRTRVAAAPSEPSTPATPPPAAAEVAEQRGAPTWHPLAYW